MSTPGSLHPELPPALFAAAIESSPVGVVISDANQPDYPILFVNHAFSTMTGYTATDVLNRNWDFLYGTHTDKAAIADIASAITSKQATHITLLNYRKDRTPFWCDLHVSPIFDATGSLTHFIALLTDVTAMHDTQQALSIAKEQAERTSSIKNNFMAMMSHEIRTPINGILGTLTLLNDMPLAGETKQLASTAYESAGALLTIVNDMLDFSKIEAGKLTLETTDFNLHSLLHSCLTLMQSIADRKKLTLTLDYDPTLPSMVAGDPTRIKQVLLNLISNALKFTEQGGVTIKVSNLLANASAAGIESIVRFEVIDTGIGMSPDGLTRIFTEFNQLDPSIARRYGGTGLGLAICRRLITMMHGEIEVESRVGEGSKFWFVLPLQTTLTHQGSAAPVMTVPAATSSSQILVVEDNSTNQLVLTKMLERAGHRCDVAENGEIAVSRVQSQNYDLVFMDVSMPIMDGLAATRAIRALGGNYTTLPIIAMTAQSMQGDRERCLGAGMNDYLSKPVNRDLLLQMLEHWLVQNGSRAESKTAVKAKEKPEESDGLDWTVLQQMAEDIGEDTVGRLLETFMQDMTSRLIRLHAAVAGDDWTTVRHEAHTLKSSAASCGLTQFSSQMAAIEKALELSDTAAAIRHAQSVDHLANAAQTAMQKAHAYFHGTPP